MSDWRSLLKPFVPLYAAAVSHRNARFDGGHELPKRLEWPVISVGNVSAGGSGKTPFVMLLAQLLRERDCAVDVLSRGYGRTSNTVEQVHTAGDAAWYGDEPLLIARRAGVPVFVGADRYQAGLLAEQGIEPQGCFVHLLDDGFQHRKLARDVDIVLVTLKDVTDRLLPAGNLREPLSSLRRADVVVLRAGEADEVKESVMRSAGGAAPTFWTISRSVSIRKHATWAEGLEPGRELGQGQGIGHAYEDRIPLRPLAFCGIARPDEFRNSLQAAGYEAVPLVRFPDHHSYSLKDMERLAAEAKSAGADGFVTTEKDAVKLTSFMLSVLADIGPLTIAELKVELLDVDVAMLGLMSRLKQR